MNIILIATGPRIQYKRMKNAGIKEKKIIYLHPFSITILLSLISLQLKSYS